MKMLSLKLDATLKIAVHSVSDLSLMLIILNMPQEKFISTFQPSIPSMENNTQWKFKLLLTQPPKEISERKLLSLSWSNKSQEEVTNSQTNSISLIYQTLLTTELNSQSQLMTKSLNKSPLKISGELKKMIHSTDISHTLTIMVH